MRWEGYIEGQKKKVLAILRKVYPMDLSEAEISRSLSVHRHTAHKYLEELLKERKITVNRTVGKYTFYKLKK